MLISVLKALLSSVAVRILNAAVLESLLLWAAEKLVESTETKHDDELLKIIKAALEGKKP